MAEPQPVNPESFLPFDGGRGKRLSVSSTTSSTGIPGIPGDGNNRVIVVNGGSVSAFVLFGGSSVAATTDCMEILPGTTQVFTIPYSVPGGLYMAGITAVAATTTTINVVAGKGA